MGDDEQPEEGAHLPDGDLEISSRHTESCYGP